MGDILPMKRGAGKANQAAAKEEDEPQPLLQPTAEDIQATLRDMVKAGYAKRVGNGYAVDKGYALTDKGRRAGSVIMQIAIMEAGRREVDVTETERLHAFLLGVVP